MADRFHVGEHALTDADQLAVRGLDQRGEERLELRLHLGFAENRRPQAGHDLDEQGVGFAVPHEGRTCRRIRVVDERHLAEAGSPDRNPGRQQPVADRLIEKRK